MVAYKYGYLESGSKKTVGKENDAVEFVMKNQICDAKMWKAFVKAFSKDSDAEDNGWRGEYWGKMMRGASLIYTYNKSEKLYKALERTVKDMLGVQRADGSFNTYGENKWHGWDIWSRKYILTAMLHFHSICKDDSLKSVIISAMKAHADAIICEVGHESEGKLEITKTSHKWLGLNACSILEPFIELYKVSGEARFLDFAEYIISTGGCLGGNLIDSLMKDDLAPYQFPVVKAYEMMSFFEGILAYYEVTGNRYYLEVAEKFVEKVTKTDITVIGSAGCTHELFDNSAVKQAEDQKGICQETCVTVTWMRLNARLYLLTGKASYMDSFFLSAYNGLLGTINEYSADQYERASHTVVKGLPFDSYSPLYKSHRGDGIGGFRTLDDIGYYGCCACISAAGVALFPLMQALKGDDSLVIVSPFTGSLNTVIGSNKISLKSESKFPRSFQSKLFIVSDSEFELKIRKPSFVSEISFKLNGKKLDLIEENGYYTLSRKWNKGDFLSYSADIELKALSIGSRTSLSYGIITLASDEQKTAGFNSLKLTKSFSFKKSVPSKAYGEMIRFKITTRSKKEYILTDYASCGKHWDKKKNLVSVWFD